MTSEAGVTLASALVVLYTGKVTIIHWNGRDLPEELLALPAGDYVLQGTDEVEGLSADEDEGLRVALASLRAGNGVAHEEVRKRVLRHVRP